MRINFFLYRCEFIKQTKPAQFSTTTPICVHRMIKKKETFAKNQFSRMRMARVMVPYEHFSKIKCVTFAIDWFGEKIYIYIYIAVTTT